MRYFPSFRTLFKQPELYVVEARKVSNAAPALPAGGEEQVKSSLSIVAASPTKRRKEKLTNNKQTSEGKKMEDDVKTDKPDNHDHDHHHDKDCLCCEKPDVAVVGKIFEFCDEKYYRLEKFEESIMEYHEQYPHVLLKYERLHDKHKHKCKVRFCVWFVLLDYEKAFEIEQNLQKKFRSILLRY